jgi:hypothetical protein
MRISSQVVILTFVYFLIWLGLSVILSMVVAVYISLEMGCDDVTGDPPCFTLVEGEIIFKLLKCLNN